MAGGYFLCWAPDRGHTRANATRIASTVHTDGTPWALDSEDAAITYAERFADFSVQELSGLGRKPTREVLIAVHRIDVTSARKDELFRVKVHFYATRVYDTGEPIPEPDPPEEQPSVDADGEPE